MRTLFLTLTAILLTSIPAIAEGPNPDPQLQARMEQMLSEGEWKTRNLNGKYKQLWLLHQVRVGRVVERLKAGQSVDRKEIDELIKFHSR